MTRLLALATAVLVCGMVLEGALFGAGRLNPWLQAHMTAAWFMPACSVFTAVCLGIAGLRHKKTAADDDEQMTPMVRRDPRTGLRRL